MQAKAGAETPRFFVVAPGVEAASRRLLRKAKLRQAAGRLFHLHPMPVVDTVSTPGTDKLRFWPARILRAQCTGVVDGNRDENEISLAGPSRAP
jgi:hypothetical protein